MTEVNVSLPPALLRGLEEKAEREGVDIDEFILQALEATQGRNGLRARPSREDR